MIRKTFGYVITILGIIGIAAYSVPGVKPAVPYLAEVPDLPLVIVSIGLFLAGLFIAYKGQGSSRKQAAEVPIYHGKEVVGYRRMKN